MEKELEEKDCPTCGGSGECITSCCTGEIITDDFQMCPECHEHCGEGECPDCEGSGKVPLEQEEFSPTYDAQLKADLQQEINKEL